MAVQCCKMWKQKVIAKEEETDLVVALDCIGNLAVFVDLAVDNTLFDTLAAAADMLAGVVFGILVVVAVDMFVGVVVDVLVGVAVDVLVGMAVDMLVSVAVDMLVGVADGMLVGVADGMLADVLHFVATNGLSLYLLLALQLGAVVSKSSDPSVELQQSTVVHCVHVIVVVDAVGAAVAVGTWKPPTYKVKINL